MRIIIHFLALTFIMLVSACQKDPIVQPIDPAIINGNIRFDLLAVGQSSAYQLLVGENYKDPANHSFRYFNDTLIASVVAEDENGFLIKEELSAHSQSLISGPSRVAYADQTFYYYLYVDEAEDAVKMRPMMDYHRARLFFPSEQHGLNLPLELMNDPELEMTSWKTSMKYQEGYEMGTVRNLEVNLGRYAQVNVQIDNRALRNDLPGQTHVYAPQHGLVRSSQYSAQTRIGFGWDLLPKKAN